LVFKIIFVKAKGKQTWAENNAKLSQTKKPTPTILDQKISVKKLAIVIG